MAVATRNPFVLPGSNPGLLIAGNIDIYRRAVVHLPNGKIATVASSSWQVRMKIRGKVRNVEVLVTAVWNNTVHPDRAAFNHFIQTGQNLGVFDNAKHATAYAVRLHKEQAKFYAGK